MSFFFLLSITIKKKKRATMRHLFLLFVLENTMPSFLASKPYYRCFRHCIINDSLLTVDNVIHNSIYLRLFINKIYMI
jgi:hypothetical protein